MKKVYLVGCLLLTASFSFGQVARHLAKKTVFAVSADNNVATKAATDCDSLETYWSEDFANGIPADWVNTGNINGSDTAKWEYRGPATNPSNATGSRGSCAGPGTPIASTTAGNGFIIYDSNYWDDEDGPCGTGQGSGLVPAPHTGTLTTGVIDLSDALSATLEFEISLRNFATNHTVLISIDSGMTWEEVWLDDFGSNVASDNPETVRINITTLAAGQENVMIRFSYDGEYYYWMIDDIRIIETPDFDSQINETFFNYDSDYDDPPIRYREIPLDHAHPMMFGADISNVGKFDLPNAKIAVSVTGSTSGLVHTDTIDAPLTAGVRDTTMSTNTFTPTSEEVYAISYSSVYDSSAQDCTPENNIDAMSSYFSVSEFRYAKDDDVYNGSNFTWTDITQYELGTLYEVLVDDTIKGVEVVVGSNSSADEVIYGIVYELDDAGDFQLLDDPSDDYDLKNNDIPNGAGAEPPTVFFPFNIPVSAGDIIMPCIGVYNNDDVTFPNWETVPLGMSFVNDGADWGNTSVTPMVRVYLGGLNPGVGIEEYSASFELGQNVPNPYNANATITYEIFNADRVIFEVLDVTGKVVKTVDRGNQAAGQYKIELNASEFSKGLYYYTLNVGGEKMTKKMVIR